MWYSFPFLSYPLSPNPIVSYSISSHPTSSNLSPRFPPSRSISFSLSLTHTHTHARTHSLCLSLCLPLSRSLSNSHSVEKFCFPLFSSILGPKVEELLNTAGRNRRVIMPTHSLQQVAQHTGVKIRRTEKKLDSGGEIVRMRRL